MGQVYTMGGLTLPDIERTNCLILWGSNPFATTIANFGRRLLDAKQRGAKLVVIDPRFTAAAAKADLFVQPRPGTDGALALGMLNVVLEERLYDEEFVTKWTYGFNSLKDFIRQYQLKRVEDITGVPAKTIIDLSKMYITGKPACIGVGNGIDQHTNSVQASRAIAILIALSGNLDQPGGNVFPVRPPLADITLADKLPLEVTSVDSHPLYYRLWRVPGSDMVDALLSGQPYPLKAMVVMAGDPAISLSNTTRVREAIQQLDFLVVHDLFMTSTAELADIVLPAASWLESSMVSTYTFSTLASPPLDVQLVALHNKVVDAPGECHSDLEFIFELARRLGYGHYFPWKTVEDAFEEQLKPTGISIRDLKEHPAGIKKTIESQNLYRKYVKHGFDTPTKKVELYSKVFDQYGYDPLPTYDEPGESIINQTEMANEYPFRCCAAIKPILYTQNQYRTVPCLREMMPEAWLEIHPQKAEELGVSDGELVVVESPRGSISIRAKFVEVIDTDTIFIPHGWGEPYAHGQADNDITPDSPRCPVSGSTSNRSFRCKVRKP
jgi:anaerobic selenocysteine-containing dehydrogenase